MRLILASTFALAATLAAQPACAAPGPDGLLFHASGDKGLTAEVAGGAAVPNFASEVTIVPDGAIGPAMRWADGGYVAWNAPGNIYAQRGTLSFFWRPRTPVNDGPFVLFRVGFADHSSWDMAFARIDWNGHGFDAFVTDANLARLRVSWTMPQSPKPDSWHAIAFGWDETRGVTLWIDGKEVAKKVQKTDLDAGLDQFGLAGRVIAPHQVQSRYNFMRGSDIDDIRVYDRMLGDAEVATLAAKREPSGSNSEQAPVERRAWLLRYGWDTATPPALTAPVTTIRKVEFSDARDLKEWMWKGIDGIPETTWPGVYNRSSLPGRDDYFELPDWNVYVEGGKQYDLTVPAGETFNRVELRGAAYGKLSWTAPEGKTVSLGARKAGTVRSFDSFAPKTGGVLHFTNSMQEQPIQEIWAYDITDAPAPADKFSLEYRIDASASPDFAALADLNQYIAGRFPPNERSTVVARPASAGQAAVGAGDPTSVGSIERPKGMQPIVHILIPSSYADSAPGRPLARAWNYGWENLHDGLDGIAIELPPLDATPDGKGLIPLDIKVMDPLWPDRQMMDVSVSVRPHEARTLWLDLRDRILPAKSFYLSIASAAPDFSATSLDGARIRLVFKDRAKALPEHIADRFNQVKDNWAFLVEEHTASMRESLYRRLYGDIGDLLRVDPGNKLAQAYWADINYAPQNLPKVEVPPTPAGVPDWAFRQLDDLKLVKQFVDWWIDERQVPYGDFGGGISDDTDLTQQWPGLALMGVEPDKINASLVALDDASYRNGMHVDGLAYITTDELHAYEEGLNSDAERLYLNWGEPRAVENLMATVKALGEKVILRNAAGHLHFSTNWYGGRKIYRSSPWTWQKPYSFVVMHAPILMGVFNANPIARSLVTGVIDGWMAHGKKDAKGDWSYPNDINWDTDAERKGDGGGSNVPLQSAWAAWRFTGDPKYLEPLESRVDQHGPGLLGQMNENAIDELGRNGDWGKALTASAAKKNNPFALYTAWNESGDTAFLAKLHADAIADKLQHMYMYTEGAWWSDRVDQPNEILQRERLGGIALRRNQTYPGNTVSWRFAEPGAATKVAILLPGAKRDRFRVIAYNTSDHPQAATMTTWNVDPGTWRMTGGPSSDGGKTVDKPEQSRSMVLERSASTQVTFAPHATTVLDFALVTPGTEPHDRPDLGIGSDDVSLSGRALTLTVHSLGSKPVPGGTASIVDASGEPLVSAAIPPIAAPLDLVPKTAKVSLKLPGKLPTGARVTVSLPGEAREVTMLNNAVALPRAQ